MIFILGGNGFVGSAYARLLAALGREYVVITRENYQNYVGSTCDLLINANGNSKKYMSDRDPKWDFDASVRSVFHAIEDFSPRFCIHLSSGDVYPNQSSPEVTREELPINASLQSRYGFHKYLAEQIVSARRPDSHLIVRMGGFVGPGLRKNAIYDMLTDAPVWLTPDSELQFISTDLAANLVWNVYERGLHAEIFNLGGLGTVSIGAIHALIGSKSKFVPDARRVRFCLSTAKLSQLAGVSLPTSEEEIQAFLIRPRPRLV